MAEVDNLPEKLPTTDLNGDEDEMLVEITEDQINDLLPDDDEHEDLVNGNSSCDVHELANAPSPKIFNGSSDKVPEEKDAEPAENGTGLNIAGAVSITASEYQSTVNEDSSKRKVLVENSKPNKRKRSDPVHIVKLKAGNNVKAGSALLTLLRKPLVTALSAEGFAEIHHSPAAPVTTTAVTVISPVPSESDVVDLTIETIDPQLTTEVLAQKPVNRLNTARNTPSVSVVQASAATTLQLVAPQHILPNSIGVYIQPVSKPRASYPHLLTPVQASTNAPSYIHTVPCLPTTTKQALPTDLGEFVCCTSQLIFKGLSSNVPTLKLSVRNEHLWLFTKHSQNECFTPTPPPPDLLMETPSPIPCHACNDTFFTKEGFSHHRQRQCTQILFKCHECETTLSASNKCAFIQALADHPCCAQIAEICLEDLSIKPVCPDHPDEVQETHKEADIPTPTMRTSEPPQDDLDKLDIPEPTLIPIDCSTPKAGPNKTCPECKISTVHSLDQHLLGEIPSENNLETRRCDSCYMYLMTPCHFTAHSRIHRKQEPYVCPECGLDDFGSREIFMKHVKKVCLHFNRCLRLTCKHCNLEFTSQDALGEHLHQKHSPMYSKCSACPMAFKTMQNFRKHQRNHLMAGKTCSASSIGKCPACDKLLRNFNTNVGRIHIMSHSLEENCKQFKVAFKCTQCKLSYNQKISLQKHLVAKHPELVIVKRMCQHCGWEAQSQSTLRVHLKLIHKDKYDDEVDVDDVSIKGDKEEEKMEEEEEEEQEEKSGEEEEEEEEMHAEPPKSPEEHPEASQPWQYECDQCQMVFENIDIFDCHLKKHLFIKRKLHSSSEQKNEAKVAKRTIGSLCEVKEAPVEQELCPECELSFSTSEDLKQHLQSAHQHESHFSCHLCGATYTDKNSLEAHIKSSHTGKSVLTADMFVCCLCQRPCNTRSYLMTHLRTHKVPRNSFDKLIRDSLVVKTEDSEPTSQGKKLRLEGDALFTCAKCSFSSESKEEFSSHIQQHLINTTAVQCSQCGLCFAVIPALKRHLRMVHKILHNLDALLPGAASPLVPCSVTLTPIKTNLVSTQRRSKTGEKKPKRKKDSLGGSEEPVEQCCVCYRAFKDHLEHRKHMRTHGMAFIQSKRALDKSKHK